MQALFFVPRPVRAFLHLSVAGLATLSIPCAALPVPAGLPQPVSAALRNPDTGIRANQCYAIGTDALVTCRSANLKRQDGQLGRDTDPATAGPADGALGFSFTRVCNSGSAAGSGTCPAQPVLGDGPDDWACVTDNVTGIMWEVKTDAGLRARDRLYTNYSADYDPLHLYGTSGDASGYVRDVNAAGLCGHSDWGLSHVAKVQSILDYGNPAADQARVDRLFLPGTQADWYWNSAPNLSSTSTAFGVDFGDGEVSNAADRSTPRHALALRNAKTTVGPNGEYEFSADGAEVYDTNINATLTWRRCVEGMRWNGTTCIGTPLSFTHEQALRRAAQQASATGMPWRVPSVKELNWIADREVPSPPIKHHAFPNTPAVATWTSTPEARHPVDAWVVDFGVGLIARHPRTDALVLRLTRDTVNQ